MYSSTGIIENMIPIKIANLQTRALCDTGATINVISQAFMSKIPKKYIKKLPNKFTTVHGIGHHQQKIDCRIQLNLEINGMHFTEQFYCFPNSHDIILGLPFLKKNNAIINVNDSEIRLNGTAIKLIAPATRSTMVRICKNEIIEAFMVSEIRVKLAKPIKTPLVLMSPISSVQRKFPGLTVVESVTDSTSSLLRLVNDSDTPVVLAKGTAVALARTIHKKNITEFVDCFEIYEEPLLDSDSVQYENTDQQNQNCHDSASPDEGTGDHNVPVCTCTCKQTVSQASMLDTSMHDPSQSHRDASHIRRPEQPHAQHAPHLHARHDTSPSDAPGARGNPPHASDVTPSTSMSGQLSSGSPDVNKPAAGQNVNKATPADSLSGDTSSNTNNNITNNEDLVFTTTTNATNNSVSGNKTSNASGRSNKKSFYKCKLGTFAKIDSPTHETEESNPQPSNAENDDYEPFDKKLSFQIKNDNFTVAEKKDFEHFLLRNHRVFATCRAEMGYNQMFPHFIDTGDSKPVNLRYYKTSPKLQAILDSELEDLMKNGFISESTSEWRSPCILVKKKQGYRLVTDFRALNKRSVPQHFPVITLDEVWEVIGRQKPKIFSSLDMYSGFHQLALHPETKHKSALVVQGKQFEWNRVPFGLQGSPCSFARTMAHVLKDLLFKTVLIFVDDILVMSDCIECHKKHLQEVFQRLQDANLTLKASKCQFALESIQYLGHELSSSGLLPNKQKCEIIQSYPVPKTVKEVRQFLGLTQYYRRFQKDYSKIAKPLHNLTKSTVEWNWDDNCQKAFDTLRQNLISPPILAYPDPNRGYIITCDASKSGLGYILSQKDENGIERVICYSGRALRKGEKNYTISELEALAVVSAVKHFHQYIYMSKGLIIRTDHSALKYIQNQPRALGRIARWILDLQNYDYEIEYRSGSSNAAADALSRLPVYPPSSENQPEIPSEATVMPAATENDLHHDNDNNSQSVSHITDSDDPLPPRHDWLEAFLIPENYDHDEAQEYCYETHDIDDIDIIAEQKNCEELGPLYSYIMTGIVPPGIQFTKAQLASMDQFQIKDGVLVHLFQPRARNIHQYHPIITQICVPKKLRGRILSQYHDSIISGGHQAFDRTFQAIRHKYFWKNYYRDIYEYQKSCMQCQRASNRKPAKAPLKPLPIVGLFDRWSIDYIGPYRQSKCKKKYILMAVDSLSGWCEAFPMERCDAVSTAQVLYSELFSKKGAPKSLLSDRGSNFLSSLIQALCDIFRIRRLRTSSYHPASNGRVERFNSFINKSLRTAIDDRQENWPSVIPGVMMAYRSTPATHSTEFSPFFLCYGKEMNIPIDNAINPNITEVAPNYRDTLKLFMDNVNLARKIAAENLKRHQDYNKQYYDQTAIEPQYRLGDLVFLYDPTTPIGFSKKLKPRWLGPYRICEMGPNHTYRLRHYHTYVPTATFINSQRIKPARLPWESKIRRQDRDARAHPNLPNDQQQSQTQRNDTDEKNDTSHQTSSKKKVNYQNTQDGEIARSNSSDHKQSVRPQPLTIEKVVNLKREGPTRWYRVKFHNKPDTAWYREGSLNIPKHLIEECLRVRTWAGKPRKRKKQK